MHRWLTCGVISLVAFTLPQAPGQNAKKAVWLKDYASAKAAVQKSGKPIFLVFR